MATIQIAIWVDSDGNARVEADDCEAFDNLDNNLSVRAVLLTVEVPEPQAAEEIEVEVPAEKPVGETTVKVGAAAPIPEDWDHGLEPVQAVSPEPPARRWFGR